MKRKLSFFIIALSLVAFSACNAKYNEETDAMLQRYSTFISSENADSCRAISNQLSNRKLNDEQSVRLSDLNAEYRQLQEKLDELERIRKEREEQERIMRSFVGTYTIRDCRRNNVSTTHVPKSRFTYEQDVSTYQGFTMWDFEIVVRDDFSVYTREINIREYDKYDRLSSTTESRSSLEAGKLYVISNHLFTIQSRSDFEIVKYAPYRFYRADGTVNTNESGFSLRTNHLVVDVSSNRIYQELKDYERRDEREGYDWVGYGCATFSKR